MFFYLRQRNFDKSEYFKGKCPKPINREYQQCNEPMIPWTESCSGLVLLNNLLRCKINNPRFNISNTFYIFPHFQSSSVHL